MSHIASIKVQVKDLDALRAACQRLGFEFLDGSKTYTWWGNAQPGRQLPPGLGGQGQDQGQCDHEIKVPGATYTVGVAQRGAQYDLLWDNYREGSLVPALGENAGKLIQAYAVEAATAEAYRQGYSVYEEALADGSVRLHVHTGE